ncbi:hypothetical protein L209DRAFT_678245 [Thermothelomyces heterothallicus CBS 203.75]
MASPSVLRVGRCSSCIFSALRPIIARTAGAGPQARVSVSIPEPRRLAPLTAAPFSTLRPTPRLLGSPSIEERVEKQPGHDEQGNGPSSDSSNSDVPWYLQVEPPRHPTLVSEPAPLPEIPDNSPKLMEPLLKYVADELGMDNLSLLDLRAIDPPPALGPGLLMVLGTARSERHLHVSADRLVRWLRGRGVTARADGLLGRNELKIKLRRLARKAKLLGNSGVMRGGDDGISTGWVCVNLGLVGGSHKEVQILDEKGRPTGFGVPQTGNTIVVQLLTESRRRDLDLEGLWTGILQQSLEKLAGSSTKPAPKTAQPASETPPASSSSSS